MSKTSQNIEPKPLPRGHAYIKMRNRGYVINIEYPELDSTEAQRMIEAVMAILRQSTELELERSTE